MNVTRNGGAVNYRLDGAVEAPVVALAHGIATSLGLWDEVAEQLTRSGYRVLRYDARGHGGTPAPGGNYTLSDLGDDLLALLDKLGIERAHVVGLSMGGMTGLGLALDHPERLLSLVCCDARASAPPDYQAAWTARADTVRREGMEAMVEPSLSRWFADGFRERAPDRVERVAAMVRGTAPDGYCGCAAALQGLNYGSRLGNIRVPTFYLVGAEDSGAPPSVMREMQQATPGARFVEIATAGHLSAIEQPDAVAAAIVNFIGGHS